MSRIPMAERPKDKKKRIRKENYDRINPWVIFIGLVLVIIVWTAIYIATK